MDLLNIISNGPIMAVESCFKRRLLILSYPLLVLFGKPLSRSKISPHVVGVRNMLLRWRFSPCKYVFKSGALHFCSLAKLGPTEAKKSLNVLVIASTS